MCPSRSTSTVSMRRVMASVLGWIRHGMDTGPETCSSLDVSAITSQCRLRGPSCHKCSVRNRSSCRSGDVFEVGSNRAPRLLKNFRRRSCKSPLELLPPDRARARHGVDSSRARRAPTTDSSPRPSVPPPGGVARIPRRHRDHQRMVVVMRSPCLCAPSRSRSRWRVRGIRSGRRWCRAMRSFAPRAADGQPVRIGEPERAIVEAPHVESALVHQPVMGRTKEDEVVERQQFPLARPVVTHGGLEPLGLGVG